jgi:hypothetical protein
MNPRVVLAAAFSACSATRYSRDVAGGLWWDDEDAAHIRIRSLRYPGADNIEPNWTVEAAEDPYGVARNPDPISRAGYIRLIGYSSSAGFVLTVIVDPEDWSGVEQGDPLMTDTEQTRTVRRARHKAILAEVAQEEAEASEAEGAEKASVLDVPLHLRIDRELDTELRRRADAEEAPASALVRRLLRRAVSEHREGLTTTEVEDIARRVAREELSGR